MNLQLGYSTKFICEDKSIDTVGLVCFFNLTRFTLRMDLGKLLNNSKFREFQSEMEIQYFGSLRRSEPLVL